MNKKRLILFGSILVLSIFFNIRNRNVYYFRTNVILLIENYNEKYYYNGRIRSVDEIIPSYYNMLLSIKPLKYEYWITEKNFKKLTERSDILI